MRILTVVGARPQFVKAAPVSRALRARHDEVLVHTGQHYDDAMSESFFRDLGIPAPDVNLGVGSGDHGPRLAAMTRGVAAAISEHRPDAVVVYGDTDSTLAGALAAREGGVPIAHVEAGLRSGDLSMPEEVNRVVVDHLSHLLLAPTASAAANLARERAAGRVEIVGDVMLDACLAFAPAARALGVPATFGVERGAYVVATIHRPSNIDAPARLTAIVRTLDALGLPVILPCHPRTRLALAKLDLFAGLTGLRVVDPLPYPQMLGLLADARLLVTDSGGLQKEACFLSVPCATLRAETEWGETVASGWNRLVDADPDRIRAAVRSATPPGARPDLAAWGGGDAAEAVARLVSDLAP